MKPKKTVLQTKRLLLQAYRDEDAEAMIDLLCNPEIRKNFMVPDFGSHEEAMRAFEKLKAISLDDDRFEYGIFLQDRPIGFVNDCSIEGDSIEIGYVIAPQYQGQGYATEAVKASIEELFRRGYREIIAGYFEENTASRRVMEKCGMMPISKSEDILYHGIVHHCLYCSICKQEEPNMKVSFEHKPQMVMIVFSTKICPENSYVECPKFWEEAYTKRYARLWQTMKPETPMEKAILENHIGMYAICAESEDGGEYWIAGSYEGGEVPEGLNLYTFPESEWVIFSAKGPLKDTLQRMNTQVWQEWFPTEGRHFLLNGNVSLEVYSAGNPMSEDYESGIWVPVLRK